MRICVVLALPATEDLVELELTGGATVADAIERSGLAGRHPGLDFAQLRCGIWSRPCERSQVLRDGDRVELYRPLEADPKEMRRKRARLGKL
jgi:putative ubiquitin-RnfH superfamily antitoxin RatB of RatAB toxin-antitoxin module